MKGNLPADGLTDRHEWTHGRLDPCTLSRTLQTHERTYRLTHALTVVNRPHDYISTRARAHTHTRTHINVYIHTHTHTYALTHALTSTYINIYIHTHTHETNGTQQHAHRQGIQNPEEKRWVLRADLNDAMEEKNRRG